MNSEVLAAVITIGHIDGQPAARFTRPKFFAMAQMKPNGLTGVRVLIVEDDPVLLIDLESTLTEAGAVVAGLCQTLGEALARLDSNNFSVAVLDFRLGSENVAPFARKLLNRGVPFVLYTGQTSDDESLTEWRECAIVEKPASPRVLISAVKQALSN